MRDAEQLLSLREVEKRYIEFVLEQARGNQVRASALLGISRWSLARRLRKFGLRPRSARAEAVVEVRAATG